MILVMPPSQHVLVFICVIVCLFVLLEGVFIPHVNCALQAGLKPGIS